MKFSCFPGWYWSNYCKALKWSNEYSIALKKSGGLSLPDIYNCTSQLLTYMYSQKFCDAEISPHDLTNSSEECSEDFVNADYCINSVEESRIFGVGHVKIDLSDSKNYEEDDEVVRYEISNEMMEFFEQSLMHKLESKKLKEDSFYAAEVELLKPPTMHQNRSREMELLYGAGSSMIVGMETAVQLSFDKYCDVKFPKYWPNIPLNL